MPTTDRIKHREARALACRLALFMLRSSASAVLQTERFGSAANESLLCMAICLGQFERKPMTPAKLADYVGIPRATVIRKLAHMQERGVIELDNDGLPFVPMSLMNREDVIAAHKSVVGKIRQTAGELSKLDTLAVASCGPLWSEVCRCLAA